MNNLLTYTIIAGNELKFVFDNVYTLNSIKMC